MKFFSCLPSQQIRGIVVLVFAVCCPVVHAQDSSLLGIEEVPGVFDLHWCEEKSLGVRLLCDKKWKQDIGKNAILFTIHEDPAVLLTVIRTHEVVTGLDELTAERVKKLGQYADGFTMESLTIGEDKAIKVQGASVEYPELRLLDLYVIHDYQLYGFLFSVNPKEEWPNYAVLFSKIMESVKFLKDKT